MFTCETCGADATHFVRFVRFPKLDGQHCTEHALDLGECFGDKVVVQTLQERDEEYGMSVAFDRD